MPSNSRNTRLVYGDFRRLRKGEGGYSKTNVKYISPSTGEVIRLREFRKHATKISYTPPKPKRGHKISRSAKLANYYDKLDRYVARMNEEYEGVGAPFTRERARRSNTFKQLYQDLKSKDNSRTGKKARALIMFGLRDEDASYDVGETP